LCKTLGSCRKRYPFLSLEFFTTWTNL